MLCERKKRVKDDSKVSGLSYWKYTVESRKKERNWLWYAGEGQEFTLDMLGLRCLLLTKQI